MSSSVWITFSAISKKTYLHIGRRSIAGTRIRWYSSKNRNERSAQHLPAPSGLPKPRLDYRDITENLSYKSANAKNRKAPLPEGALETIARAYSEHKDISSALNTKRHARSIVGERIRSTKNAEEKQVAMEEAKQLKHEVSALETKLDETDERLLHLGLLVPNDTHPSTPLGSEEATVVLSTHGPEPMPADPKRDHINVGRALGLFNFEAGALVTGSSWYYLLGDAALLELALTNYAISIAIRHGFQPVMTPDVVRADIAQRCGFQPRDQNADPPVSQMYHIANDVGMNGDASHSSNELVLSGTAEVPLAGLFANRLFPEHTLPLKVVGLGKSFRAEAGARGADTRGLYRVHQFTKLELFLICEAHQSATAMADIQAVQTEIFKGLGFAFRVLNMPAEELGASAYRKVDMEAWMPGRGTWGEISSTSDCTDYQSRRLHIRYRPCGPAAESATPPSLANAPLPYAHTLNGTAAAIPRLIVALVENGARFDAGGNVVGMDLPRVLKPFWVGGGDGGNVIRWV